MRIGYGMLFIACVCVLLASCKSGHDAPRPEAPVIPVTVALPEVKDVPVYVETVGTLHPVLFAELRPQVSGTIARVCVQEGDAVTKGTALFELDPIPYEVKVRQAAAQLAMDQAALQAAEKKVERHRDLARRDLISQMEWDELETALIKAKGAVKFDEAQLTGAQLDLEHCTLRSPIDGRVGKLDTYPGLHVAQLQTLLGTVSQMDPLIIQFSVTEKEYAQTESWDLPIEIQPLSSKEETVAGSITFLDNQFDPRSGLLLIRGRVSNPEQALRPGQSVHVRLPISVVKQAKLIPQKAIRYNEQGPYIYVVQPDQTVVLRQVKLGDEQKSNQIVLEGLEVAEQVIIDGHLRLFPGAKVDIKP